MKLALLAAAFALAPMNAQAQRGGLQVTPVIIEIPAERGMSSLRLHNGRDRETPFEVEAFDWSQIDGENVLTPTTELIVAPSVFLMPADGNQIVRLGVRPDARGGEVERTYRVIVRELPSAEPNRTGFRLQLEMSMPVFVRPNTAHAAFNIVRARDANGEAALLLRNDGQAHVKLSEAPGALGAVPDLPRYLLAGVQMLRSLPANTQTVHVIVAEAGAAAPSERAFELSDAPVLADLR